MTRVKICGITNLEDAQTAVLCGADALGFVFASSPRQVTPKQVSIITSQLPSSICKVGVFVDQDIESVKEIISFCGLNVAQLHGSEKSAYCKELFPGVIKSFRVKDNSVLRSLHHYKVFAYLLDSYDATQNGGTGQSFDWDIARRATGYGKIILAGGLTPENVGQAVALVQPYAVDVSSGVESSPGKKDNNKIRSFIRATKFNGN